MKSHNLGTFIQTKRREFARKFRYTGNIAHIENYIKVNKRGEDCIVEVFVRPLTQEEREIYGAHRLSLGMPKSQGNQGTVNTGKGSKRRDKVEKRAKQVA